MILGILAATAIAKLGGMGERANEVKLQAMVGTLNRTSGAGFWFRSINEGKDGSIKFAEYSLIFDQYITLIPGYFDGPKLENCNVPGTGILLKYQYTDAYQVHCKDGSSTTSPAFRLYNSTTSTYLN